MERKRLKMLALFSSKCAYLLIQHGDIGLGTVQKSIFEDERKRTNMKLLVLVSVLSNI